MEVKQLITNNLLQIVGKLTKADVDVRVLISEKSENGDYSTNIALKLGSILHEKPIVIAAKIADEYSKVSDQNIAKVEAVNPGFINFFLSNAVLASNLAQILESKDDFGKSNVNSGKKVVVEFSSPNIAKPFTVGHLRSTIIGAAISNLLEATGWEVARDNHLGDWGTQFGKQIYAIKTWGIEAQIAKSDNPVKDLVELYVKFHKEAETDPKLEDSARAWFKKLEDGDSEARRLWKKCIDWSFQEFDKLYKLLDITFTENNGRGYGESFFEDKMGEIIAELRAKNLLHKSEGAELVHFQKDKFPSLMILKQDGTTLYATRDLATDKFRLGLHGADVKIINEVGAEQSLYFEQLFEIEKMLGWVTPGQRIHIKHGHFRFKDAKMSTRSGNVIWLEDVLDEALKRAKDLADDKATNTDKISIGALKWNELKRDPISDVVFDWDDILNMQGNSGPYMQYAYVRTQSILRKANIDGIESKIKFVENLEKEDEMLLRALIHYPEIVDIASNSYSPNTLANYLYSLAQSFNLFYQKQSILSAPNQEMRTLRLELTAATGQVLKNGLNLLGIEIVETM